MYRVRFYKRDLNFYVFEDRIKIFKCLTFSSLIDFFEENNIDFDKIKLHCSFNDLFKHIVDYYSIKRLITYNKTQEEKKRYVSYENRL